MPGGRPPGPARPPDRQMELTCSACSRAMTLRVPEDPAAWPLHRCRDHAIKPFDQGAPVKTVVSRRW